MMGGVGHAGGFLGGGVGVGVVVVVGGGSGGSSGGGGGSGGAGAAATAVCCSFNGWVPRYCWLSLSPLKCLSSAADPAVLNIAPLQTKALSTG